MKSERLKKLEKELVDLEQWLNLGLVPKKDLAKHKEEIFAVRQRMEEEKERLRMMKESGEMEEYVAPKRTAGKQVYAEPQTLPDMDIGETNMTEGFEGETEPFDATQSTQIEEEEGTIAEEMDEDPFSDKNRWKRGVWEDPDADNW